MITISPNLGQMTRLIDSQQNSELAELWTLLSWQTTE